jgi:hypothetical protein
LIKLGNRQLAEKLMRSAIYRDYARAFSDTAGMPVALRESLIHFNGFSQNRRPIADELSAFTRPEKISRYTPTREGIHSKLSAVRGTSSAKKRTLFAKGR